MKKIDTANEPNQAKPNDQIDYLQELVKEKARMLMKRLKKNMSCLHKVSTVQLTLLAGNILSI